MHAWAAEELRTADLPDQRLNKRLAHLVEDLAAQPTASVPQACGDWKDTKAAYRFWSNPRVSPAAILEPHVDSTARRVRDHDVVLAVQDTSEANFTAHPGTTGLGHLDHPACRGLKFHSVLAVSAAGVPLGLLHQEIWERDLAELGKRHDRRGKDIEDKESFRWLAGLDRAQEEVPAGVRVVTVADSEADIYDLFARPRRPGSDLLVRVSRASRRVLHPAKHLGKAARQSPARGRLTIELPRGDDRAPRPATLTLRWLSLEVLPPKHHPRRAELAPVRVQVVLAEEEDAPAGETPVCWLLLTTLAVDRLEDAARVVRWYSYRWRIERLHYILKSGCGIEELQLATAERLENALATYSIVAWWLLWLTYQARQQPEASCELALEEHEWQALYARVHQTTDLPQRSPSLREAVRLLGRLGGFLGRKGDGEPGVKVLWRGLTRLHDIAATWKLLRSHKPDPQGDLFTGNA